MAELPLRADVERVPVHKMFAEKGRTHQSFKEECDINVVMRRWANGGVLTHVNRHQWSYGDFSSVEDYLQSSLRVQSALDEFADLPARVRQRCGNDPGVFLQLLADAETREELMELGLREEQVPGASESPESGSPSPAEEPSAEEPATSEGAS